MLLKKICCQRGLLDCINEEVEKEVFFDANPEVEVEKMPPKAAPKIEQLYDSFTEKVEDYDSMKRCLDTLGKLPASETLRKLDEANAAIRKLARDMKRTKPDFASEYPDVETERDRVFVSLLKLRRAKESEVKTAKDGNKKEGEMDSYTKRRQEYSRYSRFPEEYDPRCAPNITKLVVINNPIEKEEKPVVTTNDKNDVKEVKSVDSTKAPAIKHFFEDQNQSQRSQLLDDEQGDDLEEPDHYDVPTARATDHHEAHTGEADHHDVPTARADDHYEAHTGKAYHYEDILERIDQTDEVKNKTDDKIEELEGGHLEMKTSSENDFRESKSSEEPNFLESLRHGKEHNEFSKSFIAEESPDKNRIKSLKFLQEKNAAHLLSCNYSTTSSNKSESPDDEPVSTITARDDGHRGRGGQGAVERLLQELKKNLKIITN